MFAMRIRLLLGCMLLSVLALRAQATQQDDDFVRVSLITLGPGDKVYSLYGHTALRLECPSHGLDYCFTFEMALTADEQMRFLLSTAKAGFMAARTDLFFANYRKEGRSISQQQLNLLPQEEQQLWRMLDEELKRGAHWDYNFLTTNCSSMCVWMVERALTAGGEQLVYGTLPAALTGTYGDLLDYISADAPWARLFWQMRMGNRSSEQGALRDKLAPALLPEAWAAATIADSAGRSRPMFAGELQQIAPQTTVIKKTWFSPVVALILLITITIIIFIFIKKRKIMKKIFTSMRSKRLLLSAALVLTSALNAMAGGEDWYAYKVQVDAYPTGAGLVYIDTVTVDASTVQYAESVDREFTTTSTLAYGYAQANEGWQFLGFIKDTLDINGNRMNVEEITDPVSTWADYVTLTLDKGVTSKHIDEITGEEVSDDSLTVAAQMPLEPNNYFRAIFTRVAVQVNEMQTAMGTATIDKLVNNIGDKVTLTATPDNEFCKFENWTLNGEVVSTEPTLTLDVNEVATYVANFSDSRTVTIHFPEEGGYQVWYNKYGYDLHYQLESYSPYLYYSMDNSTELIDTMSTEGLRVSHLAGTTSGYFMDGKKPSIIHGYGDVTISPASGQEASDEEDSYSCSMFRWSGDEGVKVDTLPTTNVENDLTYLYYTFDIDKMLFNRITTGTIAPNQLYMRIFGNMVGVGLEAPEVIYFNGEVFNEAVAGIATIEAQQNSQRRGIFTLDGRQVVAPAKNGIYVTDGKKIVYRKK